MWVACRVKNGLKGLKFSPKKGFFAYFLGNFKIKKRCFFGLFSGQKRVYNPMDLARVAPEKTIRYRPAIVYFVTMTDNVRFQCTITN